MIKTAQDAYLAGRQAGMEKVSNSIAMLLPSSISVPQTGHLKNNLVGAGAGGTIAGTWLGTYAGDRDLRSAGISALGALGGGQVGSNLGFGLINSMLSSGVENPFSYLAAYSIPTLAGQLGGGYLAGRYTKRGSND